MIPLVAFPSPLGDTLATLSAGGDGRVRAITPSLASSEASSSTGASASFPGMRCPYRSSVTTPTSVHVGAPRVPLESCLTPGGIGTSVGRCRRTPVASCDGRGDIERWEGSWSRSPVLAAGGRRGGLLPRADARWSAVLRHRRRHARAGADADKRVPKLRRAAAKAGLQRRFA